MPGIYLAVAGLLEITWAVGLKYTDGLTRPWSSLWTVLAMIASFVFLALAVRSIPLGTAYAVWTGIGALGAAIFGIFLFSEPATFPRLMCIALIIAGIVGVKLTSA
jgi:quaternary ammonium compound-resistance protein SugE